MSYAKAMKHWRNPRKHKMTATRKRGNQLVFGPFPKEAVMAETKASTQWEQMPVSSDTSKYLRGTHKLWSRLADGEHIFTVRPINETPGPNDGGYMSIAAALKVKGMFE